MVHGLETGSMKQCALGPGRLEGVGRSRGIGIRHCWQVGTEGTYENNALREPAAGWGQDSEFALPCLPGVMNLSKEGLQGIVTFVCPDLTE